MVEEWRQEAVSGGIGEATFRLHSREVDDLQSLFVLHVREEVRLSDAWRSDPEQRLSQTGASLFHHVLQ